ncbi:MAG TPA: hypothetical protein PKI00_01160 [Candidatus Pacearchaeota archaeon]|nr:hypothetical protein [Candidatus Parcubacteria bacterium]HNP79442.1 hypothetical protein [Candidatus Pacearchaeota archaeon]
MAKNKVSLLIGFCVLLICLLPFNAYSKIGVGVGIGKIQVDEILRPGQTYHLPDLPVINTGDEAMLYQVSTEYRDNIKESDPDKDWINFYPNSFKLEPGSVKLVNVSIDLPIDAKPGNYFAFLQAQPIKEGENAEGSSSINIAAAAKLYFTIEPANIFQAVYYKLEYFWNKFYPWDLAIVGLIVLIILIYNFRKRFNIEIKPKRAIEKNNSKIQEEDIDIIEEDIPRTVSKTIVRKAAKKKRGRPKKNKIEE